MYKFTEEQIMIRDMVREFTKNEVAPYDKAMDETFSFNMEVYQQIYSKLVETGLMGIHIPEQYGGGGGDAITSQIVVNELAKGSASIALYLDANWLASDMILVHGSDRAEAEVPPPRSRRQGFRLRPDRGLRGLGCSGHQVHRRKAGRRLVYPQRRQGLDHELRCCRLLSHHGEDDPDAGAKGISVFIVPKDAEGLTIGKFEHKMGMRGSATCELSFDNIRIPECDRVGREGLGFKVAMMALDGARISIGSIASGLSQHAMEIAKAYANERTTFGKPIKAYQGISFKFADMAAKVRAMDLMVWDTAEMKANGQRHSAEAAMLKLMSSKWCKEICDECIQVLGGNGYSAEFHVERLYRDAKLLEIGEGTSEIQRMVISGSVLG